MADLEIYSIGNLGHTKNYFFPQVVYKQLLREIIRFWDLEQ